MNTTIDLTPFIIGLLTIIAGLIARYAVPFIREKKLSTWVNIGVYAAEQIFSSDKWKEKKQYVLDLLSEKGFKIDSTAVDAMIEATVRELRIEQGQVLKALPAAGCGEVSADE